MSADLKNQINIIDFCRDPQLLNLPLLDTQEVLLRVIYSLPMTQSQKMLYWTMTGEKYPKRLTPFQETVLVLGGRSGKSTALAAPIAVYEACCTDWSKFIQSNEYAWAFVIAQREQAAIDIGRNVIFRMIESSPYLSGLIAEDFRDKSKKLPSTFPRSRTGILVLKNRCAITALPCSHKVGRGYPICLCILDEVAWFARESAAQNTDVGIYEAVLPRQIQFEEHAKMMIISTPADKTGLLWTKYRDRLRHKKDYLCMKIPTQKIRTDFKPEFFKRQRRLNPTGFDREFGAEFSGALTPLIKSEDALACMRDDNEPLPYNSKFNYYMALDAAFGENDNFAISVAHAERDSRNEDGIRIVIDVTDVIEPTFEQDMIDAACIRIKELHDFYHVFEARADQYHAESFAKHLENIDIVVDIDPWTAPKHRMKYNVLSSCIKRRMVSMPYDEELLDELTGLQLKFLPNSGQFTVTHRRGGHDDRPDTIADLTWYITEQEASEVGVFFI